MMLRDRDWVLRPLSAALVCVLLASAFVVISPRVGAATTVNFASTSAFDLGTKGNPGDGNYNVETSTDNPGIPVDHLELASLKGDAFTLPDADANTFKWDVPSTCTLKGPTTIVRDIANGVLELGSGKSGSDSQVGVASAAGITGDFSASAEIIKVTTQPNSVIAFQFLNTANCQWQGKKSATGVLYVWNEGATVDGTFALQAYSVAKGSATLRGTATLLTMPLVWLRVARTGTGWVFSYSPDGITWTSDETFTFAGPSTVFPSFFVTDPKGGVTTRFNVDNYDLGSGTLTAGAYRTAGNWTSPTFPVPSNQAIDRVEIAGSVTSTFALDRVEILQGGQVIQTSDTDNTMVVQAAARYSGSGLAVKIYLKGNGTGTPSITSVTVYLDAFFTAASETVNVGSSTGFANMSRADGLTDVKTEAVAGTDAVVGVGTQTINRGEQVGGTFPTDVTSSDGSYVQYNETTFPPESTYHQGNFVRKTDGPGTQTVSGVGFQGKAILFWWTRQSTIGKGSGLSSGIGFATASSQEYSVAWAADNGASPSNTGRHSSSDAIAILLNGTPALDGAADLVGFTSDGFTLNWVSNPNPAQATIIHYIILGPGIQQAYVGQFSGPASGVTGSVSYTGVGFQGDAALFLGDLQTSLGDSVGGEMAFGAATGGNQAAISMAIPDNSTTNPTRSLQTNQRILVMEDPALSIPKTDQQAAFVSFNPDGFTLNHLQTATGGVVFWALVLKGGSYKLNYLVRQNVTGPQSITGVGFQPDGVLLFSDMSTKLFGSEDSGAETSFGAGSVVGGVPVQDNVWGGENDAQNPTHANVFTTTAQVITDLSLSSQATQNAAKYKSTDPDGFTLNWTAVQTNVTQKYFFLAIQAEIPSGVLDVRYDWPSLGYVSSQDVLAVSGHVGDEGLAVQVWNWTSSSWNDGFTIASTTDVTSYHVLSRDEVSSALEVSVRFIDAVRSGDLIASSFWLDYVAIEKHEFHLDVVDTISGISTTGPFNLELVGSLGAAQGNFDVLVYDFATSSWVLWLSAPFVSTNRSFSLVLTADQVSSDTVLVRFVDHAATGVTAPGVLLIDLLDVEVPL